MINEQKQAERQRVVNIISSYGMYGKAVEMADEIIAELRKEKTPNDELINDIIGKLCLESENIMLNGESRLVVFEEYYPNAARMIAKLIAHDVNGELELLADWILYKEAESPCFFIDDNGQRIFASDVISQFEEDKERFIKYEKNAQSK